MPKGIYKHHPYQGFQKGHKRGLGHLPYNTSEGNKKISETKKGKPILPQQGFQKGHKLGIQKGQKGEKHPSWQGGISFEPYSIDWSESLRRTIRERDHYTCQLCGKPQGDRAHSVHHIDYNKQNCSPNNLITLCVGCNTKVNFNREYWTEYFRRLS